VTSELVAILEKEAAAEIERVLAEARAKAEQIGAQAQEEAQSFLAAQRQRMDAERKAAQIRAQSAAQVKAAALILQAKDQVITDVFTAAEAEMADAVRDKARYGTLLRGLIREAAGGLSGRITVEANPRDLDLARQAVRELKLDAEVKAADDVTGGVRLVSSDGRFVVENTLASRVERAKAVLAPEIAALLWGS